jgi:hypothetical protein
VGTIRKAEGKQVKIDDNIEQHVRDALSACVGEDLRRFEAALDGLSSTQGPIAWSYAVFVISTVLNSILPGGVTEKDLDEISQETIGALTWYEFGGTDSVKALLKAAVDGNPAMPGVPQDKIVELTFVLASYLLQAYRPDGVKWYQYLDQIWNAGQATPLGKPGNQA